MKHLASLLLLVTLLASVTVLWAATTQSDAPDTEVRAIIDKALERSTWAAEQTYEARYRHHMTQRTRKFAGDGEVTEDEKRLYLVEPVGGVPYARLISKARRPEKYRDRHEVDTKHSGVVKYECTWETGSQDGGAARSGVQVAIETADALDKGR